jgi:hypothetical protein
VAAVQEEARAASLPPPPPPEPAPEPEPEPEPPPPPRPAAPWLKWLVAIVLGAAFTTASVGLWVGRVDPESLPGVADALAQVAPPPPRLDVSLQGRLTRLPDGTAILEVTGTIHNPGRIAVPVPPLKARLMLNGTPMRDWTIPPPASSVGPGKTLIFASSVTDIIAGAPLNVQVRFGR